MGEIEAEVLNKTGHPSLAIRLQQPGEQLQRPQELSMYLLLGHVSGRKQTRRTC
jgi:hypothetical protein